MHLKLTGKPMKAPWKTNRSRLPGTTAREKLWEQKLEKVKDFDVSKGHLPTELDNPRLNNWVLHQRRLYHKGRLSLYRKRRLEEIRNWSWEPQDEEWEKHYGLVRSFLRINGHVPTREEDVELGEWVITQRRFAKEKMLSPVRRSKLLLLDKNFFE